MSLCFVFAGTSEGRELTERLADSGIHCLVFVATEYGNSVMKKHPNINVRVGRMVCDEIEECIKLKNPDFIIDATHPHAEIITENIIKACDKAGTGSKYIRVNRNIIDEKNTDSGDDEFGDIICKVGSALEAAMLLQDFDGKVMLTTGVKELKYFATDELRERLIVRVIPSAESLEEVYRCGIDTKMVIAMEGPFSIDMNIALINRYNPAVLVTKNSGVRGGYNEKLEACKRCGIKAIVIEKKESDTSGMSVEDAVRFVRSGLLSGVLAATVAKSVMAGMTTAKTDGTVSDETMAQTNDMVSDGYVEAGTGNKKVYLIGAGVCDKRFLTVDALEAIQNCEVIIGAKRMAEFGKTLNKNAEVYEEYYPDKVSDIIDRSSKKRIAVLYSGDTGLCSGAKGLYERIRYRNDIDAVIIPGISSVSYFASKTGLQYSDYPFISLHAEHKDFMQVIKNEGGFIAICSGVKDVINVAEEIKKSGYKKKIIYGYNLSAEEEKIEVIDDAYNINNLKEGLYVIAVTE